MKSFMRKVVLAAFLLTFLALLKADTVNAQGTFTCAWSGTLGTCVNPLGNSNCEPTFIANPSLCNGNITTCAGDHSCIVNPSCGGSNQPCCPGNACRESGDVCGPPSQLNGARFCQSSTWTNPNPINFNFIWDVKRNSAAFCDSGVGSINTAIGCIPLDQNSLSPTINALLSWAMGIAGGIAFILLIIAGFQFTTSAGDPKRAKAAQELITSALAGLVFIALSILILNFIGVRVLGLPIFGSFQL